MANKVIWEGYTVYQDAYREDMNIPTGKKVRAVYDGYKSVTFEGEDGTDALGNNRWKTIEFIPHNFIVDSAKIMGNSNV